MPKNGYTSITLSDDVIAQLQDRVKKSKRTIPKEIEWLLEKYGSTR